MNKRVKKGLVVAVALIALGIVLAGIGFMTGGNNPIRLGPDGFEVGKNRGGTESFSDDLETFKSIDAEMDFSDMELIPSDKYAVEGSFDTAAGKPDIKIENGVLIIADKEKHDYFNFNISFGTKSQEAGKIKIYYPKDAVFEDIKLGLDFGKLEVGGINAKQLKINMDSGDVTLTDTTVEQGKIALDFGKLTAKNLDSKGFEVSSSAGDVALSGSLAGLTKVRCDMGQVTIDSDIAKEQYDFDLNSDLGRVFIGNDETSSILSESKQAVQNTFDIKTDAGDIRINFN